MTDSKYVINSLTKYLPMWEDTGWIGIANSAHLKATAYHLRRCSAQTGFIWVKGHSSLHGNDQADHLAKEGANKLTEDTLDLTIPDEFNLQGAKLTTMTQALAYKGIREQKRNIERRVTTNYLDITRYAIQDITGNKNKDIPKNIRQFFFKALHGTHRIGKYWLNIPTLEIHAKCAHCHNNIENMEHILTNCPANAQSTIWKLTKTIWPSTNSPWPQITLGTILGCGNITLTKQRTDILQSQQEQEH
ncbi:RnaseH-domain-containing protein [Suillus decipiens]|nr:RnaseH-domain-containing protein [Suillus decipiens]